ncbi:MAG: SagB/ThcOx family dehydrogenase [Candidatus Omnitrophota bacterium]
MAEGIGDRFQRETKYRRDRMLRGIPDREDRPPLYKEYPASRKIELSHPESLKPLSLDEILKKRRSIRDFSTNPISKEELSYLLWASTGIARREDGYGFRTSPSAGGLYPIETYMVLNNVESIAKGIYHYSVQDHAVEELRAGDLGEDVARAALEQKMCAEAAVVFIWTAIFRRSEWKYGQRAFRYVYLDAGHIAANLALAAVYLGLGSCQIAALFDDEINRLVDVDGTDESVVYMSAVGHPSQSS